MSGLRYAGSGDGDGGITTFSGKTGCWKYKRRGKPTLSISTQGLNEYYGQQLPPTRQATESYFKMWLEVRLRLEADEDKIIEEAAAKLLQGRMKMMKEQAQRVDPQ